MKKLHGLPSLVSAITLSLASASAMADPMYNVVDIYCPDLSIMSNFGAYVAGYGFEDILGVTNPIYFKSTEWLDGIPNTLNNYANSATSYDSTTGYIHCAYTSNDSSEKSFDLSYLMTNGLGGLVQAQSSNMITIALPVGVRS